MILEKKTEITIAIVKSAGALALKFFHDVANLKVERKGHQDFVSRADKQVELFIRAGLEKAFPDDGIVGEEHDTKTGNSGFTWVIDPIDGTTNFINGIPAWTIVLAGVCDDKHRLGSSLMPTMRNALWRFLVWAPVSMTRFCENCSRLRLPMEALVLGFQIGLHPGALKKHLEKP